MVSIVRIVFAIGFALAVAAGLYVWRGTPEAPPPVAMRSEPPARQPSPAAPDLRQPAPPSQAQGRAASEPPAPSAPTERPAGAASGPVAALPPTEAARPEIPADKGAFDVVRVEPSGEIVVAGRCPAGCVAELTANGRLQDKVTADASGSFAMVPSRLAPGDHQLGLRITTPDGRQATSDQSVTVSVPAPPSRDVVVVLNEPGAPSKILQRPGQGPAAAATAASDAGRRVVAARSSSGTAAEAPAALSLGAVDAENGRFFIQGVAPPGARLRVYLNNAMVAEPVAGADGRWSLRVERGLTPGKYVARVDHLDPRNGKVLTRAEAGFSYEPETASGTAAAVASSGVSPRTPGSPVSPMAQAPAASGERAAASGAAPAARSAGDTPRAASGPAGTSAAAPQALDALEAPPSGSSGQRQTEAVLARPKPSAPDPSGERAFAPSTESVAPQASAPESPAEAAAPSPSPGSDAADAANPVVASIDTAQVRRGDSLWRISRTTYGSGRRYTVIFTANDAQIRNPNLIYPGQVLVLPSDPSKSSAAR